MHTPIAACWKLSVTWYSLGPKSNCSAPPPPWKVKIRVWPKLNLLPGGQNWCPLQMGCHLTDRQILSWQEKVVKGKFEEEKGGNLKSSSGSMFPWKPPWPPPIPPIESPANHPDYNISVELEPKRFQNTSSRPISVKLLSFFFISKYLICFGHLEDLPWKWSQLKQNKPLETSWKRLDRSCSSQGDISLQVDSMPSLSPFDWHPWSRYIRVLKQIRSQELLTC